jgi:site-specific DNA-methyltransferase (adenine-specific)
MVRDLRGVIEREKAEIGVFLTLTPPKATMTAEAAAAGLFEMDGFARVPRLQIVTIEQALALRDRAVKLPARRDDASSAPPARRRRSGRAGSSSDRARVNPPPSRARLTCAPCMPRA